MAVSSPTKTGTLRMPDGLIQQPLLTLKLLAVRKVGAHANQLWQPDRRRARARALMVVKSAVASQPCGLSCLTAVSPVVRVLGVEPISMTVAAIVAAVAANAASPTAWRTRGAATRGLAAIEEAASVYRRLAAANPAAYEPHLATSLNNAIRPTMTPVATAAHVQSPSRMYMSSAISATSPPIIPQTMSHLKTTPGTRLHTAAITALSVERRHHGGLQGQCDRECRRWPATREREPMDMHSPCSLVN